MDAEQDFISPSHSLRMLGALYELQKGGRLCDVYVTALGSTIPAHRIVLMVASPVLKHKLEIMMSVGKGFINFVGVTPDVLQAVVDFVYSGKLHVTNQNVHNLLQFCYDLQLNEAVELCNNFIRIFKSEDRGEKECPDTYRLSELQDDTRVSNDNKHMNTSENSSDAEDLPSSWEARRSSLKKVRTSSLIACQKTLKQSTSTNSGVTTRSRKKRKNQELEQVNKYITTFKSDKQKAKVKLEKKNVVVKKRVKDKIKLHSNHHEQKEIYKEVENTYKLENGMEANIENSKKYIASERLNSDSTEKDTSGTKDKISKDEVEPFNSDIKSSGLPHFDNVQEKKEGTPKAKKQLSFSCQACDKILSTAKRLAFHEFSKHGIPYDTKRYTMFACDVEGCIYVAANKHNLLTHQKSRHGNERPHTCEFCGKSFKLPNVLATHRNIHTNAKIYQCPDCPETFNQQAGLDIHIKRRHKGQECWGELCHLCSEKFLQKSELCWHLFKAHQVPLPDRYKVYTCEMCAYQTKSNQDLERHKNAHQGIKQFTCDVCQKSCSTKSELKRHKKFHGEKTCKCTYENCTYACVDMIGLRKHIRLMHTHKDYKPYACSICAYKTGVKGNLDKHIRTVHNLEVVTKHTVHLKMKYKNNSPGDIITKDGRLVYLASGKSQDSEQPMELIVSKPDDQNHHQQNFTPKLSEPVMISSSSVLQSPTTLTPVTSLPPASGLQEREFVQNVYSYALSENVAQPQTQIPLSLVASDMRMSITNQITQVDQMYIVDPNMHFVAGKYHEYNATPL
ncbi:hypothetical protein CHS0354_004656 [Potamilus streckersoni]|uniref:Uncharacterized protein n=1 Tax=Potamilus streckersoni TaxID=2493646 RepID=A0AAE0VPP1_9BIVA|nr:hypothetical protein CHS0354_004656 [Potamilus streckersoni]